MINQTRPITKLFLVLKAGMYEQVTQPLGCDDFKAMRNVNTCF